MSIFDQKARKTVRAPVNPLDKCTVVSIFPRRIVSRKPTIQPGKFVLEPGTTENPSILPVGPSSWWTNFGENHPTVEVVTSSILVADSIVKDYCNGLLGFEQNAAQPGIFFVEGSHDATSIKKNHAGLIEVASKRQSVWYQNLVRQADILWARSNRNPLAISDFARLAAEALNLKEGKEWMGDFKTLEQRACPLCGHFGNPAYPVCGNCHHVIDQKRYDALNLKKVS